MDFTKWKRGAAQPIHCANPDCHAVIGTVQMPRLTSALTSRAINNTLSVMLNEDIDVNAANPRMVADMAALRCRVCSGIQELSTVEVGQ